MSRGLATRGNATLKQYRRRAKLKLAKTPGSVRVVPCFEICPQYISMPQGTAGGRFYYTIERSFISVVCYNGHMELPAEQEEILRLLKESVALSKENNTLLKKTHRWNVITFWVRIVWYAILIGLPFALYFYVLEPYFTALGSDYDLFRQGMSEIPGLKAMINILPAVK